MKFKCLEKGIVFSKIEYDLPEKVIDNDPVLKNIITLYKKGKPLNSVDEKYLYKILNYKAKVTESETIESHKEYELEEFL